MWFFSAYFEEDVPFEVRRDSGGLRRGSSVFYGDLARSHVDFVGLLRVRVCRTSFDADVDGSL